MLLCVLYQLTICTIVWLSTLYHLLFCVAGTGSVIICGYNECIYMQYIICSHNLVVIMSSCCYANLLLNLWEMFSLIFSGVGVESVIICGYNECICLQYVIFYMFTHLWWLWFPVVMIICYFHITIIIVTYLILWELFSPTEDILEVWLHVETWVLT